MYLDSHKLGWRVRILRQRHGLSLAEASERSGLDLSYLSRLERDCLQNAKPKPESVGKVLDAIGATPVEQQAVYHIELPPLSRAEIERQVHAIASIYEDSPDPVELYDDRWFIHYYNRAARSLVGFTAEEYRRAMGTHVLHAIIDPAHPLYSRTPNEERRTVFALRAAMFRAAFATQEFDDWYARIVERIYDFPWAVPLWESPDSDAPSLVLERQDFTILNPVAGYVRLRFQLNHLLTQPRFLLADWNILTTASAIQLAVLRTRPEYGYSYEAAVSPGGWAAQSLDLLTLF